MSHNKGPDYTGIQYPKKIAYPMRVRFSLKNELFLPVCEISIRIFS